MSNNNGNPNLSQQTLPPNNSTQNSSGLLDCGLRPKQAYQLNILMHQFKLINKQNKDSSKKNSDLEALIHVKEEEIQNIDLEIEKLKNIAGLKLSELEAFQDSNQRLQQSIKEGRGRMEELKIANERVSAALEKHGESSRNNEVQIREKTEQLREIEKQLEKNTELLNIEQSSNDKLIEEITKIRGTVEKADLKIKQLENDRAKISSDLDMQDLTMNELEQQVTIFREKIRKIKISHDSLSSILEAEQAKNAKLESDYKQIHLNYMKTLEKAVMYVNLLKLRKELFLSIDARTHAQGNIMEEDKTNDAVDNFQRQRTEKRKRLLHRSNSPAGSLKKAKKPGTPRSTSIPVTMGASVPNAQGQEPAPLVQPRSADLIFPPATAPLQPSYSHNSTATLPHRDIRFPAQGPIPFTIPPPCLCPLHRHGSSFIGPNDHGYSQGFLIPRPPPVYAGFDGSGLSLPHYPMSVTHPHLRQPAPLPPHTPPHYHMNQH